MGSHVVQALGRIGDVANTSGRERPAASPIRRMEEVLGRGFHLAERALGRVARSARSSILLAGLVSLTISASLSLLVRFPRPMVHDEFSYLLAADTFAHGRLSNPAHPLWVHFETFHVIQQPSYASKYPPAQGLLLALGQVIAGRPIMGSWFGTGLACAATCWMLRAWIRPRWALLGALIVATHPLVLGWGQTYWGGSVAMLGGALVLGGLRRLVGPARPKARDAALMGLGMAVLANSRPFEGMILSLMAWLILSAWLLGRSRPPWRVASGHVAAPIVLVLTTVAAAMALYNWRVTGHPLRMPYMVYETTYSRTPLVHWQPARPELPYRHEVMRKHHEGWEFQFYESQRGFVALFVTSLEKLRFWAGLFFPGITIAIAFAILAMSPRLLRSDRWTRLALAMCALFLAAMMLETARPQGHYVAPILCLGMVPVLQVLRRLRLWKWEGKPTGRLILRSLVVVWMVVLLKVYVNQAAVGDSEEDAAQMVQRARLLGRLEGRPGRHLVIVRYAPGHSTHAEWVENGADIDGAKVVWAREMDPLRDRELLDYFRDRQAWLVEPDDGLPKLVPYPTARTLGGGVGPVQSPR